MSYFHQECDQRNNDFRLRRGKNVASPKVVHDDASKTGLKSRVQQHTHLLLHFPLPKRYFRFSLLQIHLPSHPDPFLGSLRDRRCQHTTAHPDASWFELIIWVNAHVLQKSNRQKITPSPGSRHLADYRFWVSLEVFELSFVYCCL